MSDNGAKTNAIGLTVDEYKGSKTTLCLGCGHDQITREIIQATFQSGLDPYNLVKTSGIGCSSKTPAYFVAQGYGINSVHGRMPSIATGANCANPQLVTIGVSGDGDTASIGLGQFMHAVRRNTNMVYIVENNGVYGLTKGQFSATSEKGSKKKGGDTNDYADIDLCAMALELGCGFVARSFSGDQKQMISLIRAAIAHDGMAIIDCISPCVTFNNLSDSTKGFQFLRDNNIKLHDIGYVADYEAEQVEQAPGGSLEVSMPNGGVITLSALPEGHEYDATDVHAARAVLEKDRLDAGHVYTGLIYIDPDSTPLHKTLELPADRPLAKYGEDELRPDRAAFEGILDSFC
ncbi:MAG: 2-oxoacid:ferredoxin oxidoreductase subunit beta [Planctomycetota bacterium]|nr:MAG: 2-oxoacid:ferredoxin oxidoreductase subunit beta [Planctomycetota bacterium]